MLVIIVTRAPVLTLTRESFCDWTTKPLPSQGLLGCDAADDTAEDGVTENDAADDGGADDGETARDETAGNDGAIEDDTADSDDTIKEGSVEDKNADADMEDTAGEEMTEDDAAADEDEAGATTAELEDGLWAHRAKTPGADAVKTANIACKCMMTTLNAWEKKRVTGQKSDAEKPRSSARAQNSEASPLIFINAKQISGQKEACWGQRHH